MSGVETPCGASLLAAQVVVAGIDGDPQEPATETLRSATKPADRSVRAEERLLGCVRGIFAAAKGAVAQVVDLALVFSNQSVERGHVAPLGGHDKLAATLPRHASMVRSEPGRQVAVCYTRQNHPVSARHRRWLRWLPAVLVLLPWLAAATPTTDQRITELAGPASFRLLDWEVVHLGQATGRLWAGLASSNPPRPEDSATVQAYFRATGAERERLRPAAEAAIERSVGAVYAHNGVVRTESPLRGRPFPPVLLALTPPPNVLVVSPRTRIQVVQSVILTATLDVAAQEQLEASTDSTGVSSLVAPIGGLATYPAMVLDEDAPDRVLSSAAHEWLHQYLIFYPLGAGYWSQQETREINETTADLIGQEIGAAAQADLGLATTPPPARGSASFDFRGFMRETRREAEALLAQGQVDAAEAYFTRQREELRRHGYTVRKLNQAYFAFYGSYAEGFAASPANPIPGLLRALRQRSPTVGDFLVRVRAITTLAQLRQAVQTAG